jgi:glycosyltransferase involved in cell wall biosynthesis
MSMATAAPSLVVMLGTAPRTHGGIASLVREYRAAGLFERWPIRYVATHCDGSAIAKAFIALRAFITVAGLMLRRPHAVLHVHAASRASFWRKSIFMVMALAARWPIVFHLHGGGFARFHDKECNALQRSIVRFFLDRASAILVVSERWQAWMALATRNPNVMCVPNAVALPTRSSAAREAGLIAFVGRLEAAKGVYDLLDALADLRGRPELRLICAGDGDMARVRSRAAELKLGARVKLAGWLGHEGRDRLLATASLFVLPSHAEGVPVSLLEAMAAGCPVIATAVGGIPDVVRHGVNGLLVTPGEPAALAGAIARLLDDRALAVRLGAAARDTIARHHTLERALERIERVYAQLRACPRAPQSGVTHEQPAPAAPRALQETS